MSTPRELLLELLQERAPGDGPAWLESAAREAAGLGEGGADRFAVLVSLASRHFARAALAPSEAARARAGERVPGWDPRAWSLLDAARAVLTLARRDLDRPAGAAAIEEVFRYADVGELCAMYRLLCLLPEPARFTWRAGEGLRSSMRSVFEAAACDTPFPAAHLDDVAWRQMVIKALHVGAPLWRVHGLDGRLDGELARMALDLADERRSAHRPVQPELWLCLGAHGGERALASLERELADGPKAGRRAAVLALARAGASARLAQLARDERAGEVAAAIADARAGRCTQEAFAAVATGS